MTEQFIFGRKNFLLLSISLFLTTYKTHSMDFLFDDFFSTPSTKSSSEVNKCLEVITRETLENKINDLTCEYYEKMDLDKSLWFDEKFCKNYLNTLFDIHLIEISEAQKQQANKNLNSDRLEELMFQKVVFSEAKKIHEPINESFLEKISTNDMIQIWKREKDWNSKSSNMLANIVEKIEKNYAIYAEVKERFIELLKKQSFENNYFQEKKRKRDFFSAPFMPFKNLENDEEYIKNTKTQEHSIPHFNDDFCSSFTPDLTVNLRSNTIGDEFEKMKTQKDFNPHFNDHFSSLFMPGNMDDDFFSNSNFDEKDSLNLQQNSHIVEYHPHDSKEILSFRVIHTSGEKNNCLFFSILQNQPALLNIIMEGGNVDEDFSNVRTKIFSDIFKAMKENKTFPATQERSITFETYLRETFYVDRNNPYFNYLNNEKLEDNTESLIKYLQFIYLDNSSFIDIQFGVAMSLLYGFQLTCLTPKDGFGTDSSLTSNYGYESHGNPFLEPKDLKEKKAIYIYNKTNLHYEELEMQKK